MDKRKNTTSIYVRTHVRSFPSPEKLQVTELRNFQLNSHWTIATTTLSGAYKLPKATSHHKFMIQLIRIYIGETDTPYTYGTRGTYIWYQVHVTYIHMVHMYIWYTYTCINCTNKQYQLYSATRICI